VDDIKMNATLKARIPKSSWKNQKLVIPRTPFAQGICFSSQNLARSFLGNTITTTFSAAF
jgi:hypothetical protein